MRTPPSAVNRLGRYYKNILCLLFLMAGAESTLAASMSRTGRLRQAVLKSAFEGRLV